MAKKTTDTIDAAGTPATENAVTVAGGAPVTCEAPVTQETEAVPGAAEVNESGFYMYIGPNLKGFIQTGTIFRGTRKAAYKAAAAAIKRQHLVKTLIVSGDALPEARLKVRQPGNALYVSYQKLAGKDGK